MCEEEYCIDASGGPYYNTGEKIRKGVVLGKDERGEVVVSRLSGTVDRIHFNGETHCFIVKVANEEED